MSGLLNELLVFHGEASTTLARVYARLRVSAATAGCELTGRVVGPRCHWAATLPAVSPLVPVKQMESDASDFLAEAIVPDPCFWSDELPMRYTVEVQLRRGGEVIAAAERLIGFRGVGRRGRSLFEQSRRWVPRGMSVASVLVAEHDDLAAWRATPAVMQTNEPTDALCVAASEIGVWVIADLSRFGGAIEAELSRLASHAAVFLAVLPSGSFATPTLRAAALNLLLAERPALDAMLQVSPHADCVLLDASDAEAFATAARTTKLPIIAHRPLVEPQSLANARCVCDHLQRDLAPIGDFAGYLV